MIIFAIIFIGIIVGFIIAILSITSKPNKQILIPDGKIRVNAIDFLNKYRTNEYRHGIFIPEDILEKCNDIEIKVLLNKRKDAYIDLPSNIYDIIEANRKQQEDRDNINNIISTHRIGGMNLEKEGNIEAAITEYKEAIKIGEQSSLSRFSSYSYAYERLIILLHKIKDIEAEKQYIEAYLRHDISDEVKDKFTNRLNKLK